MASGDGQVTQTALTKTDPRQASLKMLLERSKAAIEQVIPKHLTADRVLKVALVATSRTPKLLECTQASILQSVMIAAQLGLEPGGPLGHAYLVPYNVKVKVDGQPDRYQMECQLIPGYRGLIALARRSGEIETIEARAVWQRDTFVYHLGLQQRLEHIPCMDGDPGPLVAVYAIARLKGGGVQIEVMSRAQIERIKKGSKSQYTWADHYDEMARKTAVRRICKYLPLTVELATALDLDEQAESGGLVEVPMVADESQLVDRLREKADAAIENSPAASFAARMGAAADLKTLDAVYEDAKATLTGDDLTAATRYYLSRTDELRKAA